jgi:hypothetical protein
MSLMNWRIGVCVLAMGCFISCTKDPVAPAASSQPAPAAASAPGEGVPVVTNVYPPTTSAGKAFNKQPNGNSAMAVVCTGNPLGGQIVFDDKVVNTVRGTDGCVFSTEVTPDIIAKPGVHSVGLRTPAGDSNRKTFVVTP